MKKIMMVVFVMAMVAMMAGCGIGFQKSVVKRPNMDTGVNTVAISATGKKAEPVTDANAVYKKTAFGLFAQDSPRELAEAEATLTTANAYAEYLQNRATQPAPTGIGDGRYKICVVNNTDTDRKGGIGSNEGLLPIPAGKFAEFSTDLLRFHLSVFNEDGKPCYQGNHRVDLRHGQATGPNGVTYDKVVNLN